MTVPIDFWGPVLYVWLLMLQIVTIFLPLLLVAGIVAVLLEWDKRRP